MVCVPTVVGLLWLTAFATQVAHAQTSTAYHVVLKGFLAPGERAERQWHETLIAQQRACAEIMRRNGATSAPVTPELDPTPRPGTIEIFATPDRVVSTLTHESVVLTEPCGLDWVRNEVMTIETRTGTCSVDLVRRRASGVCGGAPPVVMKPRQPLPGGPTATRTVAGQRCEVYPLPGRTTEICIAQDDAARRMLPSGFNAGYRPGVLLEIRDTKTGAVMQARSVQPSVAVRQDDLEMPSDIKMPPGQ